MARGINSRSLSHSSSSLAETEKEDHRLPAPSPAYTSELVFLDFLAPTLVLESARKSTFPSLTSSVRNPSSRQPVIQTLPAPTQEEMTHANHETIASIPDSGGGRRPSYGAIEFPVKTTTEAILNMPVMETTASSSSIPSLIPETPAPDSMTRIVERLRGIPCAGLVLAMMSGIFFATAGFIVKLIPDVNPIEIVISR